MPKALVVLREFDVPLAGWPAALDGLRFAHVSDMHMRRWNRVSEAARELLRTLDYDLLVATGDFSNFRRRWPKAVELVRRFFDPLRGRTPIYAVLGNHDDPRIASAPDLPITFLRDECSRVELRGAYFSLVGLEQRCRRGACAADAFMGAAPPTILLAHYPSTVFRLPSGTQVDLILSGHTHGGQIRVPWIGCLWPNDAIPRAMAAGLHRVGQTFVHVSAGVGVSLPIHMRINCPAEVAVISLRRKPAAG